MLYCKSTTQSSIKNQLHNYSRGYVRIRTRNLTFSPAHLKLLKTREKVILIAF
jgi:hypothetical protein